MLKINEKQYIQFVKDFTSGEYGVMRVGEAFIHKYSLVDPKLYHEEDSENAWDRIAEKYTEFPADEFTVDEY